MGGLSFAEMAEWFWPGSVQSAKAIPAAEQITVLACSLAAPTHSLRLR